MKTKTAVIALVSALAIGLIVPFIGAQNAYFYTVCSYILVWIILGQAWNLLGGFTGQISFGHAMFLGIGLTLHDFHERAQHGYVSEHGALRPAGRTVLPPSGQTDIPAAGTLSRFRNLAMAEILLIIARNWKSVTNGGEGIMLESGGTFLGISVSDKQEYFFSRLGVNGSGLSVHFLSDENKNRLFAHRDPRE